MDSHMTLVCSYYLSLLDTLDSPCLDFNLQPLTLTSASHSQLWTPSLTAVQLLTQWELSLISEDYHCVRYVSLSINVLVLRIILACFLWNHSGMLPLF